MSRPASGRAVGVELMSGPVDEPVGSAKHAPLNSANCGHPRDIVLVRIVVLGVSTLWLGPYRNSRTVAS